MTSTQSQSTDTSNPDKPNKRKGNWNPPNKRIDTNKAIRQRIDKGMSLAEIGASQGVSPQAVSKVLQGVTDMTLLTAYKSKRADVYASLEHKILNTVDDETIKSSSLLQRVTAAGILKTHENLETGRATVIGGYDPRTVAQGIAELRGMIQAQPVHDSQSEDVIDVHNVDDLGN